jgi:hypothetical protein
LIFELMSSGRIAALPETALPDGIPELPEQRVVLLLPYNRCLLGCCVKKNYERWVWGRPGGEFKEVFLYENQSLPLVIDETTKITLASGVVSQMRGAMFSQMNPPGEHMPTVLLLRGILKSHPVFQDEKIFQNEALVLSLIEKEENVTMTYWAVRFSLFRGDFDAIARVKTWLRTSSDMFDSQERAPKVWFSLTPLPGGKEIAEIESLSFAVDDLHRMISQNAFPVVLFSKTGYLVLSDFGSLGGATFRVWMFLPSPVWSEMRDRRKLTIRDILLSAWGYRDAVQAMAERGRYAVSSIENAVTVS